MFLRYRTNVIYFVLHISDKMLKKCGKCIFDFLLSQLYCSSHV